VFQTFGASPSGPL